MKQAFLLFILTLFTHFTWAQCTIPGDIHLKTQTEIDNFATTYPGCTHIAGYLFIDNGDPTSNITSLSGLSQLQSIGQYLTFRGNFNSFQGLNNISTIGTSLFIQNIGISNLDGLNGLTSIGGVIEIKDNNTLTNINALSNVSGTVQAITIKNNSMLASVDGLQGITTVNGTVQVETNAALSTINLPNMMMVSGAASDLIITGNAALLSIDMPNLASVGRVFGLSYNPILSTANFANLVSATGKFEIGNNAALTNCNGFGSFMTTTDLFIGYNMMLNDISALDNVSGPLGDFRIEENPALANIPTFNSVTSINNLNIINNDALSLINGFNGVTSLGNIQIDHNDNLSSIDGFPNVSTIGDFFVRYNNALQSLNGFSSVSSVTGTFFVQYNNALQTFGGFAGLATANTTFIQHNNSLTTLNAFSNLQTISGSFYITDNPALISIIGLSNVVTISGYASIANNNLLEDISPLSNVNFTNSFSFLDISNNPNLCQCQLPNVCSYVTSNSFGFNLQFNNNAPACASTQNVINTCNSAGNPCVPLMAVCKNAAVSLQTNGQASISVTDVDGGSVGGTSATVNPSTFTCSNQGPNMVTLTVMDANGNSDQCMATVTVSTGTGLTGSWNAGNIGSAPSGNAFSFNACSSGNTPAGQFTVGGSGNNATSSTTDNIAFAYQTICGTNSSITVKVETVSTGGYGGVMIRESSMPGAKQVAVFSNITNSLRHEARFTDNSPKQVQNFMKPAPYWLRLKRMGNWVFAEYSSNGVTFQPVHAVNVPMQNCVQVGMAAFTYLAGQQATATFSNVSTTGMVAPIATAEGPDQEAKPYDQSVDISEDEAGSSFTLFPNPARTLLNLRLEEATTETTNITIVNQLGQRSLTFILPKGVQEEVLDVQSLAPGMYVLRIENNQMNEAVPFLIVR